MSGYCKHCGRPLKDSQYTHDGKWKSCPKCSVEHGEERIFIRTQAILEKLQKERQKSNLTDRKVIAIHAGSRIMVPTLERNVVAK